MPAEPPRPRAVRPGLRGRVVLVAVAFLFAGAVAEIGLRVFDLPRPSTRFLGPELGIDGRCEPDPHRFWRLQQDTPGLTVNRLGLRGWLPSGAKRPGDLRIACVGDSCTFGSSVPYEESWGVRLQRLVQRRIPNRRVESILAATPGYSTWQSRVLFEREIAAFEPDITILYVGVWNDYAPAVGKSDPERGSAGGGGLRLVEIARQTLGGGPDRDAVREAFLERDEALYGRRVPLPDFRKQVEALVEAARRTGSEVLAILPPLPTETLAKHPTAVRYRSALVEITDRLAVPRLDMHARFQAFEARVPADLPAAPGRRSLCFRDMVHPSIYGYDRIARDMDRFLVERGLVPEQGDSVAGDALRVAVEVVDGPLRSLEGGSLGLRGEDAERVERVWLGERWLRPIRRIGNGVLSVELPTPFPAGEHELTVHGAFGQRSAGRFRVAAPELSCRLELADGAARLTCAGRGPAGHRVLFWVANETAATPVRTRFGSFGLASQQTGGLGARSPSPFRFDQLQLEVLTGDVGPDGRWRLEKSYPREVLDSLSATVFGQALLVDPEDVRSGALTGAMRIAVPR